MVAGSTPASGTNHGVVGERLKPPDCKSGSADAQVQILPTPLSKLPDEIDATRALLARGEKIVAKSRRSLRSVARDVAQDESEFGMLSCGGPDCYATAEKIVHKVSDPRCRYLEQRPQARAGGHR